MKKIIAVVTAFFLVTESLSAQEEKSFDAEVRELKENSALLLSDFKALEIAYSELNKDMRALAEKYSKLIVDYSELTKKLEAIVVKMEENRPVAEKYEMTEECIIGENQNGQFRLVGNKAKVFMNSGGNLYQLAKKTIEGVLTEKEWGTEIWETVTDITISGIMDARDFSTLKWNFRKLKNLDISDVVIAAYTGDKGTVEGYTYSYDADELPLGAFFYWQRHYYRPFPKELYDEGMPSLQTVKLPVTIKHIGRNAFARAYNLKEIVIPEGVETIGDYAFKLCCSIEKICFPQSIKSLGSLSFTSNDNLNEVHILAPIAPSCCDSFGNYNGWDQCFKGKWGRITRKDIPQDTYVVKPSATLYVPSGASSNYHGWYKYFNVIVEE